MQSKFIGIQLDETTDVSTKKQLVIFVTYISKAKQIETRFLKLLELKNCDAKSVYQDLKLLLIIRKLEAINL